MSKIIYWAGLAVLLSGIASTSILAVPAKSSKAAKLSAAKTRVLTRSNFVSIELQTSGGFAGIQEQVVINSNIINFTKGRLSGGGGGFSNSVANQPASFTSALSNNQLDALLHLLNETKIIDMAGAYTQPQLRDGFQELLVLRFSDEKNTDRSIVIQNYGNKAPAAYYKVTAYLRQLQQTKFAPISAATKQAASTTKR